MIMRVFQVSTHAGKEAEFGRFFHETAIPLMRSTPGIVSVTFGAPVKLEPGEDRRAFLERAREAVMALRDV